MKPHGNIGNTWTLKWTPAQDAMLSRHAAAGLLTYKNIAGEINAEFGTHYSRNSAIGRAKRLGLLIANPRVNGYPPNERKAKARKPATPKPAKPASEPKPSKQPANPEFSPLRCVEIMPRNIGLLDLRDGDCRWPYGDSIPFLYCGHPKHGRSSYCARHESLSGRA